MYNTVMAFCTAKLIGLNQDAIIASIYDFKGVKGRFEISKLPNGATVVIDYAHTADAFNFINCSN
ncbi:hypothetical protein [Solibacillus sp. FSL H8-0538]|uniref:hypothetical protein n=1 Tax=Solibacillus sp. FSL H8-0538 TaxID=2921400 RepID=UPI0030FC5EC2